MIFSKFAKYSSWFLLFAVIFTSYQLNIELTPTAKKAVVKKKKAFKIKKIKIPKAKKLEKIAKVEQKSELSIDKKKLKQLLEMEEGEMNSLVNTIERMMKNSKALEGAKLKKDDEFNDDYEDEEERTPAKE